MIKIKDGYAKVIGTSYKGSPNYLLLSDGGDWAVHTGRNNEANKIVRTDTNGYLMTGWINTLSGNMGATAIDRVYCSNDSYIRYKTPANFFSSLANSGDLISVTVASQNRLLTVAYATTASLLRSKGTLAPQTGRTLSLGDVYSYNIASPVASAPTIYAAVIGFGQGTNGTVEIAGEWTSGRGVWVRALRDVSDNWYAWDKVLTLATYTSITDGRYYTKAESDGRFVNVTGDSMTGNLQFTNTTGLIQTSNATSNYTALLKWYTGSSASASGTHDALIGRHNTGNTTGTITILPYATTAAPWGGTVGLYIGKNLLRLDGLIVLHSGNYLSYFGYIGTTKVQGTSANLALTGIPSINGRAFGNAAGNIPVNNKVVCTDLNADLLDGFHANSFYEYGYVMFRTEIDASSLDENTYYPVTMLVGSAANVRIECRVSLNSGTTPSWSNHSSGFSVRKIWEVNGSGWGTNPNVGRRILISNSAFTPVDPVRGIGLLTNSSTEYVFVRGGGKYFFYISHNVKPVLRTSTYTISSLSVSPVTTAPDLIYAPSLILVAGKFTPVLYAPTADYMTVNIPTNTSHLTNDSGFISSTTSDSRYVTSLGTSGNYLTWTKNGAVNNITIPYATKAGRLGLISCNSTTNSNLWSTIKTSNSAYNGTAIVYEVYSNGGPTAYGEVLDIVSVYTNHWQPLLWFDSGRNGSIRHRNKDYNNNTWGSWHILLDTNNYASLIDVRYVTSLGTNGNYVTWTKNGVVNNITVPYATTSEYNTNGFSAVHTTTWDCNAPDRIIYRNYGEAGSTVTNRPPGWTYGKLLILGTDINDNLNMLLMWDVAHNTKNGGTLWFRGKDSINGWAKNWCKVLTDTNISTVLSNYYTKTESDSRFVNVTGDTMTGILYTSERISSTYASGTWITSASNAAFNLSIPSSSFGGIWSANVKDGRVVMSVYPGGNNAVYLGYASSALISAGTNSYTKQTRWDADNGYWYSNGYAKIGSSDAYVLLGSGGHILKGNATNNIPISNGTVCTNLNADMLDGLHETRFFRDRGSLSIASGIPTAAELASSNGLNGSWNVSYTGASGHLVLFNAGQGSTRYILMYSYYSGSLYWRTSANSNLSGKPWKTIVDNSNYTSIITKIGTATVGATNKPIYLSAGVPTAISATVGAANKGVYLSGGTIVAMSSTAGSSVRPVYMSSGTILSCGSILEVDITGKANMLNVYTLLPSTTAGLHYFNATLLAGTSATANVAPFDGGWHIIRMNTGSSTGRFTDLGFSVETDLILYRRIYNGTGGAWRKLWDTANFDPNLLFKALSWTNGTVSGPILNVLIHNSTRLAIIPSASKTTSGVVTTTAQWFKGSKKFDLEDATIAFYNDVGVYADYGREAVAILTCFDGADPVTSSYTTLYPSRCLLALLPRGGYVGIGTTNPVNLLHVAGRARASNFYAADWGSANYLLRSDGGAAAFNWLAQVGTPTYVWGGSSRHSYYLYTPSTFHVRSAVYLSTNYVGSRSTNPLTYFTNNIGVKVAMTGAWGDNDTLWINGYSGSDLLNCVAIHTARTGEPRMAISAQTTTATAYGSMYEVWTSYNFNPNSLYWANIKVSTSSSTNTQPTFSTAYTSNWFRSTGATGWYSLTYGGGWYMTDTSYVRAYNNKKVYSGNTEQYAFYTVGGMTATKGFYHPSVNSNDYVLLAGGSYKNLTDFAKGNAGSLTRGVYVSGGLVLAMSYSLNATINAGSPIKLAYYSNTNVVAASSATIGSSYRPIYLYNGYPSACEYNFRGTSELPVVLYSGYVSRSSTSSTTWVANAYGFHLLISPTITISGGVLAIKFSANVNTVNFVSACALGRRNFWGNTSYILSESGGNYLENGWGAYWYNTYTVSNTSGSIVYIRAYRLAGGKEDAWYSGSSIWTEANGPLSISITIFGYFK